MYERKEVPEILYLSSLTTLTIPEIPDYAQYIVPKLMMESIQLGVEVLGPIEFHYFGSDGQLETLFDIRICIPIKERCAPSGEFEYYTSKSFICASYEYLGNVYGVGDAWKSLADTVEKEGIPFASHSREIYRRWISAISNKNLTELQFGLS